MSYWLWCLLVFIISFVVTEIYFRWTHKKTVVVKVVDEDGSERFVEIKPGKDPEVEELIKSLKKKQGVI